MWFGAFCGFGLFGCDTLFPPLTFVGVIAGDEQGSGGEELDEVLEFVYLGDELVVLGEFCPFLFALGGESCFFTVGVEGREGGGAGASEVFGDDASVDAAGAVVIGFVGVFVPRHRHRTVKVEALITARLKVRVAVCS